MSGTDRTQSYAQRQAGQRDEITAIATTFDRQREKYEGILPSNISVDTFRNTFLTAVQGNFRLLEADRQSLWLALQKAAGDGLKPDGREGALVIFGDDEEDEDGKVVPSKANGKKKVVWMPMVFGLLKLVRNTGKVSGFRMKLIYRGERLVISDKDGVESYEHVRTLDADDQVDDSPQNIIGAYAIVNYKDGTWEMEAMSRRQIDRVKAISRAKKGPWGPWYDEQAKKTVGRRLMKRLEKSAELVKVADALEHDDTLTIDAEDVQDQRAITQEFTGPAADIGRQPDKLRRAEPPVQQRSEPPREERPPVDQQPVGQAEQPGQQPSEDVEVWAVDDNGEVVQNDPMDPVAFAKWLYDTLKVTKNPDAIREHNADAIADATAANKQAAVIIGKALEAFQEQPAGEKRAAASNAPPPGPVAIPVPKTPKGGDHWPNYADLATAAIDKLGTAGEVDAWEALNKPTYAGKAAEIKIENRLKQRRAALASPPAAEASDAPAIFADIEAEANAVSGQAAVKAWFAANNLQSRLAALKGLDAALFEKALGLIDERTLAGE